MWLALKTVEKYGETIIFFSFQRQSVQNNRPHWIYLLQITPTKDTLKAVFSQLPRKQHCFQEPTKNPKLEPVNNE